MALPVSSVSRFGPVYVFITWSPSIFAVIAGVSFTTRNALPLMSTGSPEPSSTFAVSAGWYETSNPGAGACFSKSNTTDSEHSSWEESVTLLRYIVSRFSIAGLLRGSRLASASAGQSAVVCIGGGEEVVVEGGVVDAALSFLESLPQPETASPRKTTSTSRCTITIVLFAPAVAPP